ncbi:2-(3-amino-3-carboxypropyl)histidine synthase subunit 2 isoform X2 [Scleropages formosus]|uniref:2-(3-amino-3-carboxypropyl)histidine synthase subunit 2 n=2 Tax=Scleropages formosus TaxID=113540 RepID=A0A8C9T5F1_SCLFO|nr:2-(3-amino-3-carboxypropyl)histidine synthase subunit 2 isoform X2 [Scleropages formosus]XP_018615808.2 2-(3-amino-3-carboxypropyl)histidine synthase subunit 2 isoform X2 [Scleropages formosus]
MTSGFSTDGSLAIHHRLDVGTVGKTPTERLEEFYQIKETRDFINNNNFHLVALQFPDNLLVDSLPVASKLENGTGAKLYILGDTSYGSCCVDEVAAEHAGAQCVVHYGSACLSPSRRLPLMYVFGKKTIDLQKCAAAFRQFYPDHKSHVVILYDVTYSHVIDDFLILLQPQYENVVASTLHVDGVLCKSQGQILRQNEDGYIDNQKGLYGDRFVNKFGRQFVLNEGCSIDHHSMFFIGKEGATLTNFMMTWNKCSFCSFDPETGAGRVETVNVNKALMKRYYLVERAKDAAVVGILVGTLGVANYLAIIEQLKELIRQAGKKSYMFAMGKLNVPKLANFLEIDVYVLVACPENSLLDSSDFYRPVVTPFEMELACNRSRKWTGGFVTDFQDLLPGGCSYMECPEANGEGEEEVDMSLITGATRPTRPSSVDQADTTSHLSLVHENRSIIVAQTHTAGSFLLSRSWQGLEPKLGETAVTKAVEGRRGIAIAYEEEQKS